MTTPQDNDLLHDLVRTHGGPDAHGVPRWDFSTNANACGPAPMAQEMLRQVDARRYPDPSFTVLRRQLGRLHQVDPARIVIAASASEFIRRMTLAIAMLKPGARVQVPDHAYGEYAAAAQALGLQPRRAAELADGEPPYLIWHTDPSSPSGEVGPLPAFDPTDSVLVVDRAYAPLRLDGELTPVPPDAWQLWSPNKALGLTGVRGAYAIAPERGPITGELVDWLLLQMERLAPSWPLGAHGVAMLTAWTSDEAQAWVRASLHILRSWRRQQIDLCQRQLGWTCRASATPYYLARWAHGDEAAHAADAHPLHPDRLLPELRTLGLKLRDCRSMGLPGWVRVSVQAPPAQQALSQLWRQVLGSAGFSPTLRTDLQPLPAFSSY
ncbi:MAG: hypothetical protein RLZZ592_1312 [Pseudomonadota bacterium]|jgi:histidinol-phosphate aminotransferase